MLEKSYKSKGFLCFYSQTLKWQGQKNRSDSKFFKNPDFCCQSNSRKCMKAVFLLLNRRLLRGSDRKNRLFFRFCCFCSLKKQKKQGVESVFAVKGEKQGLGQGARQAADASNSPVNYDDRSAVSSAFQAPGPFSRNICSLRGPEESFPRIPRTRYF